MFKRPQTEAELVNIGRRVHTSGVTYIGVHANPFILLDSVTPLAYHPKSAILVLSLLSMKMFSGFRSL